MTLKALRLHIALISALLLGAIGYGFAQPEKFYPTFKLIEAKDWDKARLETDALIKHPKTANDPKSWYYRGIVFKELFKSKEQANAQSPARKNALEAFAKCISLDTKKEFTEDCKGGIKYLVTLLKNDGSTALNREDYASALQYYSLYLENYRYLDPDKQDMNAVFYHAYSATMVGDWNKAKTDLLLLKKLGFADNRLYVLLAQSYWGLNKKDSALSVIEEAYHQFPDNFKIENSYLDYYLLSGKIDDLEAKTKKIIKSEPANLTAKLLLGSIYDKKAEKDNDNRKKYSDLAKDAYRSVLEKDANNFKANYKLGHKLYVDAVFKVSELDLGTDIFALEQVQNECTDMYKEALKYMQKAYDTEQKNRDVLSSLSSIYVALNEQSKSSQIKAELSSLDESK